MPMDPVGQANSASRAAVLFCAVGRLVMNHRLATGTVVNVWGEPATGVTVDTATIDVKVACYILGSTILYMSHSLRLLVLKFSMDLFVLVA